ncbi:MAG: hypothetical protein CGEMS_1026 [Candidatus Campylobacter infans]|nr:MAG: hypothetical protein CGEMS_1026 [Candidatus Campylobacter infans]
MIALIIILVFVSYWVLFAYLYAYVLFGVLSLSKRLSVKISFLVFYAIFTLLILYFGFGAALFLAVPVIILSILILKRKQYFINFTKLKLAIASACILVYAWQLEVPQTIIVNLLPVKLEIVNDDFEYIENPKQNFGRKHNIDFDNFERKESKNFLNFKYTKYNIFACDDFTCKGDKKYVGYMWKPWSERSFWGGCVNLVGRCLGSIEQYKTKFEYFVEYSNLPQFNKGK